MKKIDLKLIATSVVDDFNSIYNYKKWPINLDQSIIFPLVEKGSNYLINEFPDKKQYEDAKDKVQEL